MSLVRARWILLVLVLACNTANLDDLAPKLVVKPGTPTDSHGHFLLDFGTVSIGTTNTLPLTLEDQSRIALELNPLEVMAPFSSDLGSETRVAPEGSIIASFTFTPTATGPAQETVTITSNGGSATVVLEGTGTAATAPSTTCAFTVTPTTLDYGNVSVGVAVTKTFNVTNTSRATCQLTALSMGASSDPAFTLTAGPVVPSTIRSGATVPVSVQVKATQTNPSLVGSVFLTVGPPGATGSSGQVQLKASASQSPPVSCTFDVAPTTINFGSIASGTTTTSSFRVTNTGTVNCVATQLQLGPASSSAFSLASPPAVPFTLAAGGQQDIAVMFAPTSPSPLLLGSVLITVGSMGSAGAQQSVTLLGAATQACAHPQANGGCAFGGNTPAATASMYLNDGGNLYSFDPATNKYTFIASFNGSYVSYNMFDIAIDSMGNMVGVDEGGTLYTIDPTTATCTELAYAPDSTANGLSFTPTGKIVVAGAEVDVYDPTTGQFTTLVPSGAYTSWGDIVGLPDGLLYWSVVAPNGSSTLLVTVDPNSGAVNKIGNTGVADIWGLSYANNILYGFTDDGQVVQINSSTATSTTTSIGGNWYGAATNPATWP